MPETRTFKNVTISDGGLGITIYPRAQTEDWATNFPETFMHADWDVEVAFTRKPRPIEVDDEVKFTKNGTFTKTGPARGVVLAVYAHKDGLPDRRWAWVAWRDLPPSTCRVSDLEHAEPES